MTAEEIIAYMRELKGRIAKAHEEFEKRSAARQEALDHKHALEKEYSDSWKSLEKAIGDPAFDPLWLRDGECVRVEQKPS